MTQKPPEIFVTGRYVAYRGDQYSDKGVLSNVEDRPDYTRYVLAAPKEDVERALEEMPELRNNYTQEDALEWLGKVEAWFRLNSETIRRVLLANAGRGI